MTISRDQSQDEQWKRRVAEVGQWYSLERDRIANELVEKLNALDSEYVKVLTKLFKEMEIVDDKTNKP